MALIIFASALAIEIGLSIYCIVGRSNREQVKNYIRMAELGLLLLFTILPVIDWSFRIKGLMFLVAIKALIAFICFLKHKEEKPYSVVRVIFRSIGSMILITLMLIPAFLFPQYELPKMTGTYEIETSFYTYVDKNRLEMYSDTGENREVNVEFWYPKDAKDGEIFPLVVFSHGAFGVRASNTSDYMNLASNGYVVCSIDHPYHSMGTINDKGKLTIVNQSFFQQVFNCNTATYTEEQLYQTEQEWMNVRVPDMNFVIDTILDNVSAKENGVYQLIDPAHIGLMGHSMGGATAAQTARIRNDVQAVIDIEGTMLGEYVGVENGTFMINPNPYPVPILNVYTENTIADFEKYPNEPFVNEIVSNTAPAHFELYMHGTDHMGITDLSLFSPFLCKMAQSNMPEEKYAAADKYYVLNTLNSATLQFFDCYLKGKGEFTMDGDY